MTFFGEQAKICAARRIKWWRKSDISVDSVTTSYLFGKQQMLFCGRQ
jgi:hypothetical protein